MIWEKLQDLEPLRDQLNAALRQDLGRMGNPPRGRPKWSDSDKELHAAWWEARIARQKEIDASIAAKADVEYLYDRPYEDKLASASRAHSRSKACRRTACWPPTRTTS